MNSLTKFAVYCVLVCWFSTPAVALEWDIKRIQVDTQAPNIRFGFAQALNDLGQVTGNITLADIGVDPESGSIFEIAYPFISGPNGSVASIIETPAQSFRALPMEINNSAQVVGRAHQGSDPNIGWITDPGGQNLHVIASAPGLDISISGTSLHQNQSNSAFQIVKADGATLTVPTLFTSDKAVGMNDAEQVITTPALNDTGALWSEDSGFKPIYVEGAATHLFDINNKGQILASKLGDRSNVFVINSDGAVSTTISLPGGLLFGRMNDVGQFVGHIEGGLDFLASIETGEVIDLTVEEDLLNAGLIGLGVADINNSGQIAATASTLNGNGWVYLLTPVPEPETYAMMLAGLSMLGFIRRRKTMQV